MPDRIKITITRKPPPPALPPFECLLCLQMIERDPYSPDFNAPPVCWGCQWRGQNRLQTKQLPYEMWDGFRTAYALLAEIDKEIARARRTH